MKIWACILASFNSFLYTSFLWSWSDQFCTLPTSPPNYCHWLYLWHYLSILQAVRKPYTKKHSIWKTY